MEEMIYLGQTDDFASQYGWVNLDELSEEEFEKERQAFFDELNQDYSYGQEAYEKLMQLEEISSYLIECGVPQSRIIEAVRHSPHLDDLYITKDYRILIPACGNAEIELEPKTKALYFLFLRHREGLYRKELHKYGDELIEIMKAITNAEELSTSKKEAIKNLINKDKSTSFNDSCKIIKNEFSKIFDEFKTRYYAIGGEKDQLRGIILPRYQVKVEKSQ